MNQSNSFNIWQHFQLLRCFFLFSHKNVDYGCLIVFLLRVRLLGTACTQLNWLVLHWLLGNVAFVTSPFDDGKWQLEKISSSHRYYNQGCRKQGGRGGGPKTTPRFCRYRKENRSRNRKSIISAPLPSIFWPSSASNRAIAHNSIHASIRNEDKNRISFDWLEIKCGLYCFSFNKILCEISE